LLFLINQLTERHFGKELPPIELVLAHLLKLIPIPLAIIVLWITNDDWLAYT